MVVQRLSPLSVPYRVIQRGGSIVNISSVGAVRAHHRGFPYDVTKGAINAMTLRRVDLS